MIGCTSSSPSPPSATATRKGTAPAGVGPERRGPAGAGSETRRPRACESSSQEYGDPSCGKTQGPTPGRSQAQGRPPRRHRGPEFGVRVETQTEEAGPTGSRQRVRTVEVEL